MEGGEHYGLRIFERQVPREFPFNCTNIPLYEESHPMADLQQAVTDFLALKRIAVVGVSRQSNQPGNLIYRKLRASGHQVFAVNPRTGQVEGDPCYPDLASVPGGVEGVVITAPPAATEDLVHQCRDLDIRHLWLHRSFGTGSVSRAAVDFCHAHGMSVIAGGCPMMFCPPVDPVHRCMRWILGWTGRLPTDISTFTSRGSWHA